MAARIWSIIATLLTAILAHGAIAQDQPFDLTPAGKAILQRMIAADDQARNSAPGLMKATTFPLPMCAFPGGLCGAVRRDGTVAIPPRYDWVGMFSDGRAAVRLSGLYGFVDEDGHEVVKPQYKIAEGYALGFAQVDVDGKSGLIDRDGKMVIEPKYGFVRAIGPDRFSVSERRRVGGLTGSEDFSGRHVEYLPSGGIKIGPIGLELLGTPDTGVIDSSGHWIEPLGKPLSREFDKQDPSLRWVQINKLWGLARADGSWVIEPKFEQADRASDGLARVTVNGKVGFIDRTGAFVIAPVFDRAWSFKPDFGRTSAQRDGIFGVIDKTGSWIFQTNYQQIHLAETFRRPETIFGWHFKNADRWGLLKLDGGVLLDAEFDQIVNHCADGRLVAYKNKEWLYFQEDGRPLQPPGGRLTDAACGAAPPYALKIGDKFGLVDASSNPLTPVQFDAVSWAGPNARNVKLDGKWGRIGRDGHWLLEPKFDYLSRDVDLLVASIDGKRGFMRSDGSWLVEPKFEAARRRDQETGFATVSGATGVLRLADQSWVVPPRPGAMCDINNAIMSDHDGKRAILSRTGETWIDIGAERIGVDLQFGLLTFLKSGKWGLVDTAGQVIVEPQFDEPVYFAPSLYGIAWAKRDGNWCAIDRRGHSIPGIACTDANPMGGPRLRFACEVE